MICIGLGDVVPYIKFYGLHPHPNHVSTNVILLHNYLFWLNYLSLHPQVTRTDSINSIRQRQLLLLF